ncbi:hypothetical protein F2P56_027639 [Juglans regia]|uniref:PPM-type phosphatase domain-containing protein n=2 Tax=Juglans regia TaxID=51240 RepID=A0A2I4DLQ5_JUGRE|nr:putative protein phosphatase 2C-like protein 44 isoform X1 [Juglans regia]XP_018808086.1 putative protein phosphatase 2C-like protein 44 isoform X1 [Juglans regia]KAF5452665.1 hypothetical protein F2P56_027639 [Juglans regia]
MGLKDLHLKLKVFRLKRFLIGNGWGNKRELEISRRPSWMIPVSHGYYVVEDQSFRCGWDESDYDSDFVVVQREQIEELELWFFGVFDAQVGDGVTKYMQSHLFDKNLKQQSQIRRKSKETMRKAYLSARAKIREMQKADETGRAGSVSVLVTNAEKLVTAFMGDYRAVVCRDGVAHQIRNTGRHLSRRHWSRRLKSVRIFGYNLGKASKQSKGGSELLVGSERIDSSTEFVILASTGIWEVMKNQEAVNLIRHMEDAQEAAECLAKEALTRMSKSNISCLIIRFD